MPAIYTENKSLYHTEDLKFEKCPENYLGIGNYI
jgi:hypothetical protein